MQLKNVYIEDGYKGSALRFNITKFYAFFTITVKMDLELPGLLKSMTTPVPLLREKT